MTNLVQKLLGYGQFRKAVIMVIRKLPLTYNGKMVKLHFYALKKWQMYYVISSKFLSVRPSVRANKQGLEAIFGLFWT